VRRYIWLAIGVLAGTLAATIPPASAAPRIGPTFEGGLFGVAALSPSYAWAVGSDANNPLILAWNGKNWRKVPAANPSPGSDDLDAVAARTARDAWAVGARGGNALVLHWNGRTWTSVPNPLLKGGSLLVSVVAMSEANAWAVGGTGWPPRALIEHWNGKTWQRVASPYTAPANLEGVAATSATNMWAVGTANGGVLILHWNGKSWRRVPAPSPKDSELIGVTVTSAVNAWAVGDYSNGTITSFTLIEHWNGKTWTRVPGPSPRQGAVLFSVTAKSASLAFAVGQTTPLTLPPANPVGQTFLERWDGHTWREITRPAPIDGQLAAVAIAPGPSHAAFAVGSNDSLGYNPNGWTLIERWNGAGWG
jgi:hypothetical protein